MYNRSLNTGETTLKNPKAENQAFTMENPTTQSTSLGVSPKDKENLYSIEHDSVTTDLNPALLETFLLLITF